MSTNRHDRSIRIRAMLFTFAFCMAAIAIFDPCCPIQFGTATAGLVGVIAWYGVAAYHLALDHLDRELSERRSRRFAALAIDD